MATKSPILHILVVGFHHKKGCQVEFSYPPLIAGTEGRQECPSGWKYLPTLALPDGSHNFNKDFVCFNLPSLVDPHDSIYGISCYRQIPVEELKIRTADVTRSTVQKSVCALLSIPIYGYVEVKLSLIAHAYFEQGDFDCTEILVRAYEQLNACLTSMDPLEELTLSSRLHFVGLPLRELVLKWRHKLLMLYKLLLLQKRVVCYGSPVQPICALILGVVSLHPGLLADGFQEVACVKTSRPMSPMPTFGTPQEEQKKFSPVSASPVEEKVAPADPAADPEPSPSESPIESPREDREDTLSAGSTKELTTPGSDEVSQGSLEDAARKQPGLVRETSVDTIAANFASLCAIKPDEWAAPIRIFHEGNLCLPYISLPYMDLLSDPSVKGYIIGASNVLFQQKRNLADVMIDVENAVIDVYELELKRQVQLSTEDLRFADFIIKNVQNPKEDAEGSEVWIREQFYGYMVAMVKSSLHPEGSKELEHFNVSFMNALKQTACYQDWLARSDGGTIAAFENQIVGHPFAGTLSVADMKLRIAQTMQNSESGRKLNQAVNSTSRVVGGALTTAKGAFSTWWTSITAAVPAGQQQQQQLSQQPTAQSTNNSTTTSEESDADVEAAEVDDSDDYSEEEEEEEEEGDQDSQSKNVRNNRAELPSQIETAEPTLEVTNNIIEIGKEAEMLDRKQRIFNV